MPIRESGLRQTIPVAPKRTSLFRVFGKGLDPSKESDLAQLKAVVGGIQTGNYSDEQIKGFIEENPAAAPFVSSAVQESRFRKDVYGNFAGESPNAQNAVMAALRAARPDEAKKILELTKGGTDKNISSVHLGMRAAGLTTGDPRVDNLTKKQAQAAVSYVYPSNVLPTTGGAIVAPRGQAPGFVPNPDDVPPNVIEKLSKVSATYQQMKEIESGFKGNYGGFKSDTLGNAAIAYKKRFGDESGMVQWWQQYQEHKNLVRNQLFGSALTDTERVEFDKANVSPGMDPKEIKTNLARQRVAAARAAKKLSGAFAANKNYNQRQLQEAVGNDVDLSGGQAAPQTTAPSGGLSAAEQAELSALRQKHGR